MNPIQDDWEMPFEKRVLLGFLWVIFTALGAYR
jgi:hypothetical protein